MDKKQRVEVMKQIDIIIEKQNSGDHPTKVRICVALELLINNIRTIAENESLEKLKEYENFIFSQMRAAFKLARTYFNEEGE